MDRSLLSNATTQDDAPTPGYMLAEISSKLLRHTSADFSLIFSPNQRQLLQTTKQIFNYKSF